MAGFSHRYASRVVVSAAAHRVATCDQSAAVKTRLSTSGKDCKGFCGGGMAEFNSALPQESALF